MRCPRKSAATAAVLIAKMRQTIADASFGTPLAKASEIAN
jgi:hypothetical protein